MPASMRSFLWNGWWPVPLLVSGSMQRCWVSSLVSPAFLQSSGSMVSLAYTVVLRTQEIGIRMALGARQTQVLGLVIRKGLSLASIGIVLGLVAAAAGSKVLQTMLFGITPLDRPTFIAVSLVFGAVTLFASYLPARRATIVNPLIALRTD